jgi:hypothetical protein
VHQDFGNIFGKSSGDVDEQAQDTFFGSGQRYCIGITERSRKQNHVVANNVSDHRSVTVIQLICFIYSADLAQEIHYVH